MVGSIGMTCIHDVMVCTTCTHDSPLSMIPQLSLDDLASDREVALYHWTMSGYFDILGAKSTTPCLGMSPEIEHS